MQAQDIYNMGIEKFNGLLSSMDTQNNIIKLECTALDYARTLVRMYAEADGDYYKCCGSDIYNDNCRLSYCAVCRVVGTNKNGIKIYKMLPGGFSAQKNVRTAYKIIFSDKVAYLLRDNEFDEARPITVTVKSVTGNIANREYMTKINHVRKMESTDSYVEYAKKAIYSEQSDNAILADGLSDAGFNIVVDKFINSITKDNISIMDMIAEKVLEKQYEDSHTYKYQQSYDGVYKIKNIYSNEIIKRSIEILDKNRRLLIMGNTGDGKTSLAYLLAKEITGEDIGEPTNAKVDTNYYRICVAGAGDGNTLWEIDDREKNLGKLRLFVEHIQKEKITQPCVFICNEIQVSDLRYLIGNNLFEDFSNSKRSRILPDNLFLIFTGCTDSDFGIDEQITQRITPVEIKGLYANDNDIKIKLADAFPSDNGGKIIDTVAEINSTEEYTVITMRKLIQMLRGEKPNLGIREDTLSNKSKKLLEELRGYYDN